MTAPPPPVDRPTTDEKLCACGHTYTSHDPGECTGCTGPACDGIVWPVLRLPLTKGEAELTFVPHVGRDTATLDVAKGAWGHQTFTCNNITRWDALRLYHALGEWLGVTNPAARGVSE